MMIVIDTIIYFRHWGDDIITDEFDTRMNVNFFNDKPIKNIFSGYSGNFTFYIHGANEIPVYWNKAHSGSIENIISVIVVGTHIVADANFQK